jgi:signal transduction histidine kinase
MDQIRPNNSPIFTNLLLIGFLYPGWSFLLFLVLPNEFQSMIGRSIVGAMALICALGYRKIPSLAGRGTDLVHGIIAIMTVHFIVEFYHSGVSYVYVVGMLVFSTAVGALIESSRFYFVFCALYIFGPAIVCFITNASKETTVMLLAGLVTLSIIYSIVLIAKEKLQRQLAENQAALESSRQLESLSQFAGGVAHELNNPLTVTLGYAELLLRMMRAEAPVDKAKCTVHCEKIIATSKRAGKIASSLLIFTQATRVADLSDVPVSDLLNQAIAHLEAEVTKLGIHVEVEKKNIKNNLSCIAAEIILALTNLIQNAIYEAAQCKDKWIKILIKEGPGDFNISVQNSGPGIPPENMTKVFQPFFTTKPIGTGEGLGLSIAFGIALKHGGSLTLDTKEKATTFVLKLPKNFLVKKVSHNPLNAPEPNLQNSLIPS